MLHRDKISIERIRVISWLGFIMYVSLLGLDAYRFRNGYAEHSYYIKLLFYTHLGGLLFLLPALATTYAIDWSKATRFSRELVIWYTLGLMTLVLFGQALVAFKEYESLTLFIAYVIVSNWTFSMNFFQRVSFNLCSVIIMTVFVLSDNSLRPDLLIVKLYEIFFIAVIAFIFHSFDSRLLVANFFHERSLAREKARIEELEGAKSRMYTNLTHEFRTPLTVIAGMAAQIDLDPKKWREKGTDMIRRNAARILNLVNQILDLDKLDSGVLSPNLVHGDVITYLGYIVDSFRSYAEGKQIGLHFLTDIPKLDMDYDPEKSLTIISNLIANAIKFTPEGGHIYVRAARIDDASEALFQVRIRDTGTGIPEDKLDRIFDRFYQVEQTLGADAAGTGIGLSITKELVKLLGGNIHVAGAVGGGTEFVVDLPVNHDAETSPVEYMPSSIQSEVSSRFEPLSPVESNTARLLPGLQERIRILLIEDNTDVATYVRSVLESEFNLVVEQEGNQGIEVAIKDVPDLIISDLMLPGVSGYEICKLLKANEITSHIPIILLTAKVDQKSKIEGFESGADAYISKPFDKSELIARIRQLIDSRRQLQLAFQRSGERITSTLPEDRHEDVFLTKARQVILARLDDATISVTTLCRALGMSRTQLHNKIKALTGRSTTYYVRAIRLAEAQQLLGDQDLTIAEIAYQTGFTDPAYFTRVYREEFGESPSDFRNQAIRK
jgi:signal transduction histidine kinase/DNA-binding response OmpR family regulator